MRCDFVVLAVKTDPAKGPQGPGSLLVVERDEGLRRLKKLKKLGWRASDTGELFFEDCRVPVANRLGDEGEGFYQIMGNFEWERHLAGARRGRRGRRSSERALAYTRERQAFGKPIAEFQVVAPPARRDGHRPRGRRGS